MAKNKKTEQTSEAPTIPQPSVPPPPRKRQAAVIQPELAVEIANCKKRISSLKSLNKLAPVIEQMDNDALNAMERLIAARREKLPAAV